jgi:hypothetical protein
MTLVSGYVVSHSTDQHCHCSTINMMFTAAAQLIFGFTACLYLSQLMHISYLLCTNNMIRGMSIISLVGELLAVMRMFALYPRNKKG